MRASVKPLNLQYALLILGTILWLSLTACGKLPAGNNEVLSITLQIPNNEDPELFWYGLEQKTLTLEYKGERREYSWGSGQAVSAETHDGEKITFSAFDAVGDLRVTGEATVGKEKRVSVPLRRVL